MLIENKSKYLLKKTRAKAKMYEYRIAEELHIEVEENVPELLLIAIGVLGSISSNIIRTGNTELIDDVNNRSELEFSSKFFDAFLNSKLDAESDYYYYLLGAVAYFLSNRIGSSQVLIKKINNKQLDLDCNGIENLLTNIICNNFSIECVKLENNSFNEFFKKIEIIFSEYNTYKSIDDISVINQFRSTVYELGSSLELLLFDSFFAILLIKLNNSAIKVLPMYSKIDGELWKKAIVDGKLISELWPSQRKLGNNGIYSGKSAVIQMPTGTGKTKSISLIIYSAFISNRAKLAIVVAPFRSLCREITYDLERDFIFDKNIKIDQLSDILQLDETFLEAMDENSKSVIVLTPEKLLFVIRQKPDLIKDLNLIIFDEAHLFDDGHRGTTYELLVSVIKSSLGSNVQKILISAVMSNANQLNEWINSGEGVVITDSAIKSTDKQIAITDLRKIGGEIFGYLFFFDPQNPDDEEFYVPRLINFQALYKFPRERKLRIFPEMDANGKIRNNDIAIYYGIHLCMNDAVAVFCGRKDTANKILERILDLEERGYNINTLKSSSNEAEINRIIQLISENYGENNIYYKAAIRGAFVHHAGISNGLRLSIEYSMRKGLISFLVCTSTLAQGVNLPIRYLVVSSLYQGREHISVRDFHNLIGRAGRAGVYTEGSILLTETGVYNLRNSHNNWKWYDYKRILDEKNSEPCLSTLLNLVRDVQFTHEVKVNFYNMIINYYTNEDEYLREAKWINELNTEYAKQLMFFHESVLITLDAVESFVMSYLFDINEEDYEKVVTQMLEETYGYFLSNDEEKNRLINLFRIIGEFIINNTDGASTRLIYSKSLMGIKKNKAIEEWLDCNIDSLSNCHNELQLFEVIAPMLFNYTESQK